MTYTRSRCRTYIVRGMYNNFWLERIATTIRSTVGCGWRVGSNHGNLQCMANDQSLFSLTNDVQLIHICNITISCIISNVTLIHRLTKMLNTQSTTQETKSEMQTYIMRSSTPILNVIKEGKFRWLVHVMRRESPSMLYEVVNYKEKETSPRGRPRTTWLKSMDNQLKEKGSSMKDTTS